MCHLQKLKMSHCVGLKVFSSMNTVVKILYSDGRPTFEMLNISETRHYVLLPVRNMQ